MHSTPFVKLPVAALERATENRRTDSASHQSTMPARRFDRGTHHAQPVLWDHDLAALTLQ
jgi:hypothetical protein